LGPTTLLAAEVIFVGARDFSSDRVIMLQEQGGPRQLPLEGVDATTGEVVQRLLDNEQPLTTTTHDLLARLVTALDARVHQVAIRRLAEALFGDITLDHHGQRRNVQARPGDAVALGLLAGAPSVSRPPSCTRTGSTPATARNNGHANGRRSKRSADAFPNGLPHHPHRRSRRRPRLTRTCGNRSSSALTGCAPTFAGGSPAHPRQRHTGRLGRTRRPRDHAALLPGPRRRRRRSHPPVNARRISTRPGRRRGMALGRTTVARRNRNRRPGPAQQREQFTQVTDRAVRELESFLHPPG
jgi:bifunctional DNase/RNase